MFETYSAMGIRSVRYDSFYQVLNPHDRPTGQFSTGTFWKDGIGGSLYLLIVFSSSVYRCGMTKSYCKSAPSRTYSSFVTKLSQPGCDQISLKDVEFRLRSATQISICVLFDDQAAKFPFIYRPNSRIVIMTDKLLELHCSTDQTEQTGSQTEKTDDFLKFINQGRI